MPSRCTQGQRFRIETRGLRCKPEYIEANGLISNEMRGSPGLAGVQYVIARKIRFGRWVAAALSFAVLAFVCWSFAVGKIDWRMVGRYMFEPDIVAGMLNTIILATCAMVSGVILGLVAALMLSSGNPVLRTASRSYIFVFRSVPIMLQLLIWYNLALVFPTLGIAGFGSVKTTEVITPFVAALLAFGIAQGAYTSEVIRSGLLAVGQGQFEAASSLGMTQLQMLRRIVIPQAMRIVVPPLGNEMIGMVKYTSLASIIQYRDIIYGAQSIYYANGRVIELLIVCTLWYTAVVALLSLAQDRVEKHYNKGSRNIRQLGVAQ
ncbi:MAG: amino acid ABC transporter permease [Pseudomonadota bacterium]